MKRAEATESPMGSPTRKRAIQFKMDSIIRWSEVVMGEPLDEAYELISNKRMA